MIHLPARQSNARASVSKSVASVEMHHDGTRTSDQHDMLFAKAASIFEDQTQLTVDTHKRQAVRPKKSDRGLGLGHRVKGVSRNPNPIRITKAAVLDPASLHHATRALKELGNSEPRFRDHLSHLGSGA